LAKAEWLLQALASARPKIASAVIRCMVIEAPCIDETVILRPKPARDGRPLADAGHSVSAGALASARQRKRRSPFRSSRTKKAAPKEGKQGEA